MQTKARQSTSSTATRYSNPKVVSLIELGETDSPSLREIVVIRRETSNKVIVCFKKPEAKVLTDPTSFQKSHIESVHKKYSDKRRRRKDFLEDKLNDTFCKLPFTGLDNILTFVETDIILYRLYTTCAYTINRYFGKQSPKSVCSADLLRYVQKLIPISANNQNIFNEIAKDIEPIEFFVDLIIIEISRLKSIKNVGYLFCKVWLNSEPHWVEMTNAIDGTSCTMWNTRFFFATKDLENDAIIVEICRTDQDLLRGKDPALTTSRMRQLFRKISGKSCSIEEEDDKYEFIGKIEVRVCDIYSEGVNEWLPITETTDESEVDLLHIEANFRVNESDDRKKGLQRHLMVLRTCLNDCLKNVNRKSEPLTNWEQVVNRPACTLVFLHSFISGITPSEDIVSRFVVAARVVMKTGNCCVAFVYHLLQRTVEHLKQYPEEFIENELQLHFKKLIRDFYEDSLQFISSLHSQKLTTERKILSEFEFSLRSIYLCADIIGVVAAPLVVLKLEALKWLEIKVEKLKDTVPNSNAAYAIEFLDSFIKYQKAIDSVIQNVIPNETLTHLIYKQYDEELVTPLKMHAKEISRAFMEEKDLTGKEKDSVRKESVELLLKIKELVCYISKTTGVSSLELKMANFREWLGQSAVANLFQWAELEAEEEIEIAVNQDYLYSYIRVPLDVGHLACMSYSAEHICESIQQLANLWSLVSIPRSQEYDKKFLNGLNRCCNKYGNLVMEILETRKLLDNFYFDGRRCMCVLSNNLWYVYIAVKRIIQDTVEKLPPDSSDCRQILMEFCEKIIYHIIDKCVVDIAYLVEIILENKEVKNNNDTFREYVGFMRKLVWTEVSEDMKMEVFIVYLKCLSKRMIELLRQFMDRPDIPTARKKDTIFYKMIIKILNVTVDICSISDSSEENEKIWSGCDKILLCDLEQKIKQNIAVKSL